MAVVDTIYTALVSDRKLDVFHAQAIILRASNDKILYRAYCKTKPNEFSTRV